jgi:phospholipid-binding lipoprotein MlaA
MNKTLLGLGIALSLTGCATVDRNDPRDPLEGFNRGVYSFNTVVDDAVLKPVAKGYVAVVPQPARQCVANMFANVGDVWSSFNSFIQGRGHEAINSAGRVVLNSTVGVFGCFDLATGQGVPRVRNDFGQTLGVWGVGPGPYVVLPVLGSSTVRDTGGLVVDSVVNPLAIGQLENVRLRNTLLGVYIISTRAGLLDVGNLVNDVAIDPYSFTRDAYLQRREAQIRRYGPGTQAGGNDNYAPLPNYGDDDAKPAAPAQTAPGTLR